MARVVQWRRSFFENRQFDGSTSNFSVSAHSLAPGETHIKTFLSVDLALSMTIAPDTDVGLVSPMGLAVGTSSTSIPGSAYSNPQPSNFRWLYWSPVYFRFEQEQVGSPNIWAFRNDDHSRYVLTESQYKNTSTSTQFLWFVWSPSLFINWVSAGMKAFGSVAVETLVMEK